MRPSAVPQTIQSILIWAFDLALRLGNVLSKTAVSSGGVGAAAPRPPRPAAAGAPAAGAGAAGGAAGAAGAAPAAGGNSSNAELNAPTHANLSRLFRPT